MNIGDGIDFKTGMWSFGGDVAVAFDDHVKKSVPYYEEGHDLICKLSDHFIGKSSSCIDVGCSTGALLRKLNDRHSEKSPRLMGIDIESGMISEAEKKSAGTNIQFSVMDALNADYKNTDLVIFYYSLQFIPPKFRQTLLSAVWEGLNWGGGLVLFEKVRGSDARFHDILTAAYWDYKQDNGYSDEEILAKWRSLRRVLEPFTPAGNLGLLQRAGWSDIETVWKWGPFQGFLAIK